MPHQLTFADVEANTEDQRVDLADLPTNERVLLVQGITRVMHTPSIVEGETSSTGKTIAVEDKHSDKSYRLDAETIFSGGGEYRGATSFQLYTPETHQRKQEANYAPGPQTGANEISDTDDLPEPTHLPAEE